MMNQEEKKYLKKIVDRKPFWSRMMLRTKVAQIKATYMKGRLEPIHYKVRFNPWNPFTYIVLVGMLITGIIEFFITELLPELIAVFKWK